MTPDEFLREHGDTLLQALGRWEDCLEEHVGALPEDSGYAKAAQETAEKVRTVRQSLTEIVYPHEDDDTPPAFVVRPSREQRMVLSHPWLHGTGGPDESVEFDLDITVGGSSLRLTMSREGRTVCEYLHLRDLLEQWIGRLADELEEREVSLP